MVRSWWSALVNQVSSFSSLRRNQLRMTGQLRCRLEVLRLEDRLTPTVNVLSNFRGLNAPQGSGVPPDTCAAAGPNYVVETVNTTVQIYNKTTAAPVFTQTLPVFFASLGAVAADMFDPVVTYDDLANRFVIAAVEENDAAQTSFLDFAVSNSSDPTAGFTEMQQINVKEVIGPNSYWGDFPRLGWNADAYVIGLNMYTFPSSTSPGLDHAQIIALTKSSLLDQNPATFSGFASDRFGPNVDIMAPASMHGSKPGDPMWFVQDGNSSTTVDVIKMTNVLSIGPVYTVTPINVNAHTAPPPAPQLGGGIIADTGDTRMLNAEFRNGRLMAAQTIGLPSDTLAHAAWYEFNTTGVAPTLTQSGVISPGPGIFTWTPSIAIATTGELGLTYMQSSANQFVSMYVTGQALKDPLNTMESPALIHAGTGPLADPSRSGDFSGISVDPTKPGIFWAANEIGDGTDWGTWLGSFTVQPFADLVITKDNHRSFVLPGNIVVYTITVTNLGPDSIVGTNFATVTDSMPAGLVNPTWVAIASPGARVGASSGSGDINTTVRLPVGSNVTFFVSGLVSSNLPGGFLVNSVTVTPPVFIPDPNLANNVATDIDSLGRSILVYGADAGTFPEVRVFDAATQTLLFDFLAYAPAFRGGVRVAAGDVNNDGVPDIITAPGPGGGPMVEVFSGVDLSLLMSFNAYNANFVNGLFVAAGDTNADGYDDIVTGPDAGGGPLVQVFSGATGSLLLSFNAYDPSFLGGVRVAAGDMNANGRADIVTGPGPGGGPLVEVFNGSTASLVLAFNAYDPSFLGGIYVAVGDTAGRGKADIFTGPGLNGGPLLRVFDGTTGTLRYSANVYDTLFHGGVRVAFTRDQNGDFGQEVVATGGPGGLLQQETNTGLAATIPTQVFDGLTLALLDSLYGFQPFYFGGAFVAGSR